MTQVNEARQDPTGSDQLRNLFALYFPREITPLAFKLLDGVIAISNSQGKADAAAIILAQLKDITKPEKTTEALEQITSQLMGDPE